MNNNNRNQETVCAVVVTYNRKNLLLECLEAIRKQTRPVDAIYLIDNSSTDGTPELLMEKGYISELPPQGLKQPWEKEFEINNLVDGRPIKLHYVLMHENTGGAGGFYEGMKKAYEKGYDWFWLMDDDCEPDLFCLDNMMNEIFRNTNIKMNLFGPLVKDKKNNKIVWHEKYLLNKSQINLIEVKNLAFNGLLVNKHLVSIAGFVEKKLVLYGDDREFSFRAKKYGFRCYVCSSALLYHPIYRIAYFKIFNKTLFFYEPNVKRERMYYHTRNAIYLMIRYYYEFSVKDIYYFLINTLVVSIINFLNFRFSLLFLIFKSIFDGIKLALKN